MSNQMDGVLSSLSKASLAVARAVLPVYKTTPTSALYKESGILPPEIALDHIARKALARLYRLDPGHPLRLRGELVNQDPSIVSRLARRLRALPKAEQADPIAFPL